MRKLSLWSSDLQYITARCWTFEENSMYKAEFMDVEIIESLGMKPGDTVELNGLVYGNKEKHEFEYISLFLSDKVLTDFIDTYGFRKIEGEVVMKLQLFYIITDSYTDCKKEITGYKVLEINHK